MTADATPLERCETCGSTISPVQTTDAGGSHEGVTYRIRRCDCSFYHSVHWRRSPTWADAGRQWFDNSGDKD